MGFGPYGPDLQEARGNTACVYSQLKMQLYVFGGLNTGKLKSIETINGDFFFINTTIRALIVSCVLHGARRTFLYGPSRITLKRLFGK